MPLCSAKSDKTRGEEMIYLCLYITSNTHRLAAECRVGGGCRCVECVSPHTAPEEESERSCTLKALILQLRTQSASVPTPVSKHGRHHLSPPSDITRASSSKQRAIVYSVGEKKKSAKPPSDLSCSEREKKKRLLDPKI